MALPLECFPKGRQTKQERLVKLNLLQSCNKSYKDCVHNDSLDIYDRVEKLEVLKTHVQEGRVGTWNRLPSDAFLRLYDRAYELYCLTKHLDKQELEEHRSFLEYVQLNDMRGSSSNPLSLYDDTDTKHDVVARKERKNETFAFNDTGYDSFDLDDQSI